MKSYLPIFDKTMAHKLTGRAQTFRKIIEYLETNKDAPYTIIETGSLRKLRNWQDGQSTIIWDEFLSIHVGTGITIDLDPKATALTELNTKNFQCICGDSVKMLSALSEVLSADLVYLDSFDLDTNNLFPSAFHHMMELTAIYNSLKSGCLLVVDDCVSDQIGKHVFIKFFMDHIGKKPYFTGYQCAWII